ncbi:MAG: dephospho-CoA kinase [Desulfonauticus sp.]|nr:dephospho-CoA kinase [Desulfonauticus sp.]
MNNIERYEVSESDQGIRLDVFLSQKTGVIRSQITKQLKQGCCKVNQKVQLKSSYRLKSGDIITFRFSEPVNQLESVKGNVNVIHEEEDFIVVDKPPYVAVHPGASIEDSTLVNFLLYHFPQLKNISGERPGIVHRLDKDTTGLLVVALKESTREYLSDLFSSRKVSKIYLALVKGKLDKQEGVIETFIGRDPKNKTKMAVVKKKGKIAKSAYKVLWTDGEYSLLQVQIFTGRTHQIRVHLKFIGHPILGDKVYGGEITGSGTRERLLKKLVQRQMLHAAFLSFPYRDGKVRTFRSELPPDFKRALLFLLKEPLIVILQGLPGSGKTMVAKMLVDEFFEADKVVHNLYQKDGDGYFILRRLFGDNILNDQGEVDKNVLFNYLLISNWRLELQKQIYPIVFGKWLDFVRQHRKYALIVGDIPAYLEGSFTSEPFPTVLVGIFRPEVLRKQALLARGWSEEKIVQIDSWQMQLEKKFLKCAFILDNSGDIALLKKRVHSLKKILRRFKVKKYKKKLQDLAGKCLLAIKL